MPSFDIPELTEVIENLKEILKNQKALAEQLRNMESGSLPAWIGLKEACALKGINVSTIQKPENRHLMPLLSERERVGKALKWPRDVILKWLLQKDQELEAVKKKLAKVRVVNATPRPMDELVAKEPAPLYDQFDKADKLISDIEEQSRVL